MEERGEPGASYPALQRYIKMENEPALSYLRTAAQVLNVRSEWLILGTGPDQDDATREQFNATEYYAALAPPARDVDAWRERVDALNLDVTTRDAVWSLPFSIRDSLAQLEVGDVQLPSGRRDWRPSPAVRDAMRLELRAWITLLDSWVDDVGSTAAAEKLVEQLKYVRRRFLPPWTERSAVPSRNAETPASTGAPDPARR